MKTRYSILIICLLALFATGCKKENNGHIRIFTENMRGDSKILINPNEIDHSTWMLGEYIAINGNPYMIDEDLDNGGYCLNGVNAVGNMLAIYPAGSFGGNDIVVSNNEVILNRLTVNFCRYEIADNEGGGNWYYYYNAEDVVFPMSATAAQGSDQLLFNHLTAGLMLTLSNNTSSNKNIASIKIVAQSDNTVNHLDAVNGVTARWAVQGPTLPQGDIGDIDDDYLASYACEMNFDFTTTREDWDNTIDDLALTTTSGVTLWSSDDLTFCVPITISSFSSLTITGYSSTGNQLFHVTKDLTSPITILRNTMYTVPPIEIQ